MNTPAGWTGENKVNDTPVPVGPAPARPQVAGLAASAAPHKSWLAKIGSVIGKALRVIATDAKPVADTAAKFATAFLPQFAGEIAAADGLVTKITVEAAAVEGAAAAAGNATGTGAQKLETVVQNVSPAIDAWVAAAFPGSKQLSAATKAGLVNAVVAIANEVDPAETVPATTN
jgi:hypothetical protein